MCCYYVEFFRRKVKFFRPPMSSFFPLRREEMNLVAKILEKEAVKRLKLNFVLWGKQSKAEKYYFSIDSIRPIDSITQSA
jgi:hypothetical protein